MGSTKSNVSFQGTENDGVNFDNESPAASTISGPHDNAAPKAVHSIDPPQTNSRDALTKLTSKDILRQCSELNDADFIANTILRRLQQEQLHATAASAGIRLRTNITLSTAPQDGLRTDETLEAPTRLNDWPDESLRPEQAALTEDLPSLASPDARALEVSAGFHLKRSI
eukprot:TRINITY_DN16343_c0_g3_i3.p1 TRINITY_DN16343_c0_g3~~TRINITY_DN16343_c0_g3_i3.p1  ORF type:complete len:186 (-),score=13.71 TRINITY_DN16343_c0_g3_i3:276-785(-)